MDFFEEFEMWLFRNRIEKQRLAQDWAISPSAVSKLLRGSVSYLWLERIKSIPDFPAELTDLYAQMVEDHYYRVPRRAKRPSMPGRNPTTAKMEIVRDRGSVKCSGAK